MNHKIPNAFFKRVLMITLLFWANILHAQKYNFQHYDLVNGLSQSQVLAICQDKEKQIWLSNFSGINYFDGNQFNSLSVQDGLTSNSNFAISCDNQGNIWWGGNKGLTSFTSKGLVHYGFKNKVSVRSVLQVLSDKNNTVWALAGHKLYKLVNNKLILQQVMSSDEVIASIQLDHDKNIYAAVYHSGIYKIDQNNWKLTIPIKEQYIIKFIFDARSPKTVLFIYDNQLFRCTDNKLEKINIPESSIYSLEFYCLLQDHNGNIWIGTNKGALLLNKQSVKFFNENNGFTSARILGMFCDADNHLWFGTDGAGLYYYENDDFVIYDKSQGLNNELVMSMAADSKGKIYLGTNGGGLWSFSNNKIKQEVVGGASSSKLRINCLLNDKAGNLWVGTDDFGLWKKSNGSKEFVYAPVDIKNYLVYNYLAEDASHTIWAATNQGCFYMDNGKMVQVPLFHSYCASIAIKGPDSVFVGTSMGVMLIRNKVLDTNFRVKGLGDKGVLTLKTHGQFILIGTNDYGLFIWNTKTNAVNNLTVKNGLHSNTIYNIDVVNDELWLGTGKGINKFKITDFSKMTLTRENIFNMVAETNENAVLHTDSNIWIGTTHGLYVYKIKQAQSSPPIPNTIIQNIGLFIKDDEKSISYIYKNGYSIPVTLSLPSDKSHITIKFQAIAFGDEKNTNYEYQLEGLEKTYNKPMPNNVVDYPSLPPGQYTFKVRAINSAGLYKDPATFSFTITPTFVQSATFKILMFLLLLSTGYAIYVYKNYKNNQKARYIEALKLEEQAAVRRQTAEDFHDDLGNKLTRINMLSELLDKKISKEKNDEKLLIQQIRSSVTELYAGTKNILWALNPDNDNLHDVCGLIIKFGKELFSETRIEFNILNNDPEFKKIRLPLGSGRNIILIGKELLHNILQHSNAKIVTLSIEITSDRYICIMIADDGKGFECDQMFAGSGLRNMQNRAKKLNGNLDIKSEVNVGTTARLSLPIP